jgi:polyferredoxin
MILSDLPLLMIVTFTLVTTLVWGRVFCSSLCPFGALQDMLSKLVPRHWQQTVPAYIHDRALYLKYAILALIIVMAVFQSGISIFHYFEPFGTLFFYSTSIILWSILIVLLLASTAVKRFYCRYACPLGAALGVLSLLSLKRIKRVTQCSACKVCEHACPTGAIRNHQIDFKECVRCDICEQKLITRAGVCKHSVESLEYRGVELIHIT